LIKKIKALFKKNETILTIWRLLQQYYYKYFLKDEEIIRKRFKDTMGKEVNLENPVNFNDKLQWLKLNWYDHLAVKCADKYKVREFVIDKIGEEYLNELYAVYNSVDEIDLSELPKQFVLKGTHGSGFNIICRDKSKINWKKEKKRMKRWLKINYHWKTREWVYKDIKPKIICEKLLLTEEGKLPRDYKFHCFHGNVDNVMVAINRETDDTKFYFFDKKWNLLEYNISGREAPKDFTLKQPKKINQMFKIAQKLSEEFPFVRVDLYYIKGQIYLGELTFFPQSGMDSNLLEDTDKLLGNKINLNEIN